MRTKLSTTEEAEFRAWAQTHGKGTSWNLNLLRWRLYQKAKNESKFRFYALYDRIWRRDTLETAWHLVAKKGKAAGVDGVTAEVVLSRKDGVERFISGRVSILSLPSCLRLSSHCAAARAKRLSDRTLNHYLSSLTIFASWVAGCLWFPACQKYF